MNRLKKKEMLKTVQLLEEASEELNKNVGHPDAGEVLVQCQETAIFLGNNLETFYSDTKKETVENLITILEDYCESIYQISTDIANEKFLHKISRKITKQLSQLRNRIKFELPDDRKEIVFLPYKASMWDSLESVWKTADADKNTDAYVIPIPYYDKNPDGSFREMHYEGSKYPDYVPVTYYRTYDLEARRPDIIYIHNPYDNNNYVTSVHPDYYSDKLKEYADKLVYIPYFILEEIDPGDTASIKNIKHFCTQPGVFNADEVIVQSENIKKIYVNVLTEYAGKKTRKYWENKILGLGSPKIDKVMNTHREELKIPEEWQDMIQKPDGSLKKIVFYNTGVSALLFHNEKMIRKMENVFALFHRRKDEIVLLWRPHPLLESTLKSMRPQLWKAYKKVQDRYIDEGWGIYDDTADSDRAVILSDAYYGDGSSSILQLYQKSGKISMIQNVNLSDDLSDNPYINAQREIEIEDAVFFEDKIWFCAMNFNSLFYIDLCTKQTICAGRFPGESYGTERLYIAMRLAGRKIYFIPFNAVSIAVFDIDSRQFEKIELDQRLLENKSGKYSFIGAVKYHHYLFIYPAFAGTILRFNTDNNKIDYITDWIRQAEGIPFNKDEAWFMKQAVVKDSKLMIPFWNANAVLELECDTLKSVVYRLRPGRKGYSGICCDGHAFWMLARESEIFIKWKPKEGELKSCKICKEEAVTNLRAHVSLFNDKEKILIFPLMTPLMEGDGLEDMTGKNIEIKAGTYYFVKEEHDNVLYFRQESGMLTIVNKTSDRRTDVKIAVDHTDIDSALKLRESKYVVERAELSVSQLLDTISMTGKRC